MSLRIVAVLGAGLLVMIAHGSDHNNLDKERPLSFEDARSIALGAREFQNGIRLDASRNRRPLYPLRSELQVGFAPNRDFSVGWEPEYGSNGWSSRAIELSYFEGIRREIDRTPALGYRVDVSLPGGPDHRGFEGRFRTIVSTSGRQFERWHVNLDLTASSLSPAVRPSAILGYSTPVGVPTRFDTTLLAEAGVNSGRLSPGLARNWLGLGMRHQLTSRGVLDVGIQWLDQMPEGSGLRFVVGYSKSF